MKSFTRTLAAMSVLTSLSFADYTIAASSSNLYSYTVPASSCGPSDSNAAKRVKLVNGAWVFAGTITGAVLFYCPVHLNGYHVNEGVFPFKSNLDRYRVYYRDSDGGILGSPTPNPLPGQGQWAKIITSLTYRDKDGMYTVPESLWNSNITSQLAKSNTTATKSVNTDLKRDVIYAFKVILYRAVPFYDPAFSGIDFPAQLPEG